MSGTVGVIVLANLGSHARVRACANLAFGPIALSRVPGLVFAKMLGSGSGGGFGLTPSLTHQGVFAAFIDEPSADAFLAGSSLPIAGYRRHTSSLFTAKLRAYASRGRWSGRAPLTVSATRPSGLIAALTRASIAPSKAPAFWRHAPPSQSALATTKGCLIAAGLGEMPLLRQATFTLWESEAAMDAYARSGAHLAAIRAAHAGGYFTESLFARFVPYAMAGSWAGRAFSDEELAPEAAATT